MIKILRTNNLSITNNFKITIAGKIMYNKKYWYFLNIKIKLP